MRGGWRPGAGRPRKDGSPNGKTVNKRKSRRKLALTPGQILAINAGIQPLDYMLRVLRSEDARVSNSERMAAAVAAAPYIHPRLVAQENTNINHVVVHVVIEKDDAALL